MSARGAASRLRALPSDATATEVLCAALGCDRRGLASLPGGAARALASLVAETGELEDLARELDEQRAAWWRAALSMPDGRLRMAVGLVADDYGDVARREGVVMGGLRDGMTCREVEAWLLSRGFERMPTGKGSHRRYARGPDRVTLPYKRGHDRVSASVIRDVARGARVRLDRGGVDD